MRSALFALAGLASVATGQSYTLIPNTSDAKAVSLDGTTVVGTASTPQGDRAYVYRAGVTTIIDLIDPIPSTILPPDPEEPGNYYNKANAVSADGTVVVGGMIEANYGATAGWYWTAGGGVVHINPLQQCEPFGVSGDGSVIVGGMFDGALGSEGFRWSEGGANVVGCTGGSGFAWGVSADGASIGGTRGPGFAGEMLLWTFEAGPMGLSYFDPLYQRSGANGISGDGTTVVGYGVIGRDGGGDFFRAGRWKNGVLRNIGALPPVGATPPAQQVASAFGVNGDGSVVVGNSFRRGVGGLGSERAFVWIKGRGMQRLETILTNAGVNLNGYIPIAANGVSADGRTIVGVAMTATFQRAGYVAVIPPICVADLNGDGIADFNDYLEFLNLYNANDLLVDMNEDGIVDFNDYLEFLNLYNTGC